MAYYNLLDARDLLIDDSGHPADVPAYQKQQGDNVDVSGLTIVFYGKNDDFKSCISIAEELKKRRDNNEFMIGTGNQVRYYGLLSFEKGDMLNQDLHSILIKSAKPSKRSKLTIKEEFPFDSVFLQGNCNRIGNNPFSYDKLVGVDGKRNDLDLAVQVIYHLGLTHDVLSFINQERLNVVGAFSLYYEPEKERNKYAIDLTNAIVEKFSTDDTGEHWYRENDADISDNFKLEQGWKSVYGRLKSGFKDIETNELIPQSTVSPWSLFLKVLIPYYFKN